MNDSFLKGKKVLDVGVGSGVLSLISAKEEASYVLGTDISNNAISSTEKNIIKNNFSEIVEVKKMNLADDIDEKFDVILANLPIKSDLWGFDSSLLMENFLQSISNNFHSDTKVYIPWGSFSEKDIPVIEKKFLEYGWDFSTIEEFKFGLTWWLYVLKQKSC